MTGKVAGEPLPLTEPMLATPAQPLGVAVNVPLNPVSDAGRVPVVLPLLPSNSDPLGDEIIPAEVYTDRLYGQLESAIVPPAIEVATAPVLVKTLMFPAPLFAT